MSLYMHDIRARLQRFWSAKIGPLTGTGWVIGVLIILSIVLEWAIPHRTSLSEVQLRFQTYIDNEERTLDRYVQSPDFFLRQADPVAAAFQVNSALHWFLLDSMNTVVGWNHHQVTLSGTDWISNERKSGGIQLSNGYFLWKRYEQGPWRALALLPLQWSYSVNNEYLRSRPAIPDITTTDYQFKSGKGSYPLGWKMDEVKSFSIIARPDVVDLSQPLGIILLRLGLFFWIAYLMHQAARRLAIKNPWLGFLRLFGGLLTWRMLSYFYPIPIYFRQFKLFDPTVYGANFVLRSLGDLLINLLLLVWVVWFFYRYVLPRLTPLRLKPGFALGLFTIIQLAVTFYSANVLRTLVADSQLSFDVINFFSLNAYTVAGFLAFGLMALLFYLVHITLCQALPSLDKISWIYVLLALAGAGLAWMSFQLGSPNMGFSLIILVWLLVFVSTVHWRFVSIPFTQLASGDIVFWLFFFSASITVVVVRENERKELDRLQRYAENLADRSNPSGERLMNTVLTDFRNEALVPLFPLLRDEAANLRIKDSLLNQNFTGYLNKFDTRLFTFDPAQKPLFNIDSTSYNTLMSILNSQARPTNIPDLYYYDVSYDQFNYISKKVVADTSGKLLGYLFLVATPRRYRNDALYPELFLKGYERSLEHSAQYAYGIYNKFKLVANHNDYPFPLELKPEQLPKTTIEVRAGNKQTEIWYRSGSGNAVVLVRTNNLLLATITLFSYLFFTLLLLALLFWLGRRFIRMSRQGWRWREFAPVVSIRNQVQGTLVFLSLLSFLVIGVATIWFFINQFKQTNRDSLGRVIQIMRQEMGQELLPGTDSLPAFSVLSQRVNRVSELHSVDVNLFDTRGNLLVSSLALPYDQGVISTRMPAPAYRQLILGRSNQYFAEESIGALSYQSIYLPILGGQRGAPLAYLNIPYYTTEVRLKKDIAQFLVTIINLNAFIFLIAGLVAFILTNRITRSFSFIRKRIREISLGKSNALIDWPRQDEIGELVQEYNRMVIKLDASAAALAQSEREGAWREMARQVAHEIKNPLTPMKLSLQYLQKQLDSGEDRVADLTRKVTATMVEQIDHLSHIAGEFSQFANIGNPKPESVDLHTVLEHLIRLFSLEPGVRLNWSKLPDPVPLFADKTHLNRLFTNLIRNAIQAVPEEQEKRIQVVEYRQENYILIEVRDNGVGIPEAEQAKIFVPNFTTKTSGTGLGLAMCKGMVEQAQGEIWFETQPGLGTSFFVKLPLQQVVPTAPTS